MEKNIKKIREYTLCGDCIWASWGKRKEGNWFYCDIDIVAPNEPIKFGTDCHGYENEIYEDEE